MAVSRSGELRGGEVASRAILFTHLGRLELNTQADLETFWDQRGTFFESCLRCANVSLVFVYSSYGIESYVRAVTAQQRGAIPLDVLDTEHRIHNAVQTAIKRANDALESMGPEVSARPRPKFVFVGVRELATHLSRLQQIDQKEHTKLVESLASEGEFTYDSPKFVEAIIRLRRPREPVLRIDADVEVDESAIQQLLDKVREEEAAHHPYYWFSGGYKGNYRDDVVNEFAVRVHWFVHEEPGIVRRYVLPDRAISFLVDLGEIGAPQLPPQTENPALDPRLSEAARRMIAERRNGLSKNRGIPQVISGAGLVASAVAIQTLPPFLNAPEMVVWIDDYLKRLLHKRLGHLGKRRIEERVRSALMKQERYPDGITQADLDFCIRAEEGRTPYFKRLLNGCLMDATIENPDGTDGPLALATRAVVVPGQYADLAAGHPHAYTGDLMTDLMKVAAIRFDDVMAIWRNADADYDNSRLGDWARAFTDRDGACEMIARIGMAYVELCRLWERHLSAIERLGELEAFWVHETRSTRR